MLVASMQLVTLMGLPMTNRRKVQTTSYHHAPYDQGNTRATMDGTTGSEIARWSQSHKTILSSDCRLQLAYLKQESLVIAHQHAAVNTFPGLVHAARHSARVRNTRRQRQNPHGAQLPKVGAMRREMSEQGCRMGRRAW